MVKCEVCNEKSGKYLTADIETGDWYFECSDCETYRRYFILSTDAIERLSFWRSHLSKKTWFDMHKFNAAIKRYIEPTEDYR